jgi:heme/copper-type cytochrome/quinol oxidase subunit 2
LSQQVRARSRWWYLLPIFFQIIGGVIAYFILRDDDPKKAKNCLWLGIVLTAIKIGLFVVFISICSIGPCAEFHDEFMTGIKQGTMGQGMMGSEMTGGMMQDPQAMNQWMNTMMNNLAMRQQMMDTMMNNPQMMQSMMNNQDMMDSMMGQGMVGSGMMGNRIMPLQSSESLESVQTSSEPQTRTFDIILDEIEFFAEVENEGQESTALVELHQWNPNLIVVNEGDTIVLNISNPRKHTHTFSIPEFGVSTKVLEPRTGSETVQFVADKAGIFTFSCGLPYNTASGQCDPDHSMMTGTLIVIG